MARKKGWPVRLVCFALFLCALRALAAEPEQLKHLERSFSLHASLAALPQSGNWDTNFPSLEPPGEIQIHNAARLLTQDYNANRLYLIYQKEISLVDAERVFQTWREACPVDVEVVPALVLSGGATNQHEFFSALEIRRLSEFFKQQVNPNRLAVLCSQDESNGSLTVLATNFGSGLVRLGLQPAEKLQARFSSAVADTWSAFCSGQSNDRWREEPTGLRALQKWIAARNEQSIPISWSLIVVGCEHSKIGSDAAFDREDPERNAPVESGRNAIAIAQILQRSKAPSFAGFSTDLNALQASSQAVSHDGSGYSFYEMLKRGQLYVGYYARPFLEIVNAYGGLRSGKAPQSSP